MFNLGIVASIASVLAGGVIATATVVGVVNSSVNSAPAQPGSVSGSSVIQYGSR
ncbi:hypothetical protein GCM10009798_20750 [Nocardioides panacihumi]|uniref:DUF2613 family protein n=1 Tax=Nocardioides panacihumi TaxID=400774 RepID=A0ABN2QZE2_9ACTN